MDTQKQQAAERVKQANNILVTVSNNPSVDQLAACIGLTIALNKLGKHATAVFSGAIPSTIEFLQPEKTIEKNTDSLRDFIIALDKSKADKLRYKVEDRVVKIFITPYKTSISDKDLEFSQGDFNVDVVLALGVHNQSELDQAITSHGRILHDATVITMNTKPGGELGGVNWLDPGASSLSELGVQLIDVVDKKLIDTQMATALLTGIVAETDRFSNAKTSPQTMSISAELMAAGANQQLVATKLEEPIVSPPSAPIARQEEGQPAEAVAKKPEDGTLEISHEERPAGSQQPEEKLEEEQEEKATVAETAPEPEALASKETAPETTPPPAPAPEPQPEIKLRPAAPQISIDEHGSLQSLEDMLPPKPPTEPPTISHHAQAPKMVIEPPTLGGQISAAGAPSQFAESNDIAGLSGLEEAPTASPMESAMVAPSSGSSTASSLDVAEETPSGGAVPAGSFLVGEPTSSQPEHTEIPAGMPTLDSGLLGAENRTLSDIEKDVHSSHMADITQPAPELAPTSTPASSDAILPPVPAPEPQPAPMINDVPQPAPMTEAETQTASVDSARDAVMQAINSSASSSLDPIEALNAQPLGGPVQPAPQDPASQPTVATSPIPVISPDLGQLQYDQPAPDQSQAMQQPYSLPTDQPNPGVQDQATDPNAPPPVPPPMMPATNPY
ncbi:MAG TPA: hypothetical protein VF809_00800 [Candidatus Saccharimonadales bacterium]